MQQNGIFEIRWKKMWDKLFIWTPLHVRASRARICLSASRNSYFSLVAGMYLSNWRVAH